MCVDGYEPMFVAYLAVRFYRKKLDESIGATSETSEWLSSGPGSHSVNRFRSSGDPTRGSEDTTSFLPQSIARVRIFGSMKA
jgi:hypothetical protein